MAILIICVQYVFYRYIVETLFHLSKAFFTLLSLHLLVIHHLSYKSLLFLAACQSVLEQDTGPQIAPDVRLAPCMVHRQWMDINRIKT